MSEYDKSLQVADDKGFEEVDNPIFYANPFMYSPEIEANCKFIGKHYGLYNQLEKLQEELDELDYELHHVLRLKEHLDAGDYDNTSDFNEDNNRAMYHLAEELADLIVVSKTLFSLKPELASLVEAFIKMKSTRQVYRITTKDDDVGSVTYDD